MAQLAIEGHTTRGREVIEILEMLGGKNIEGYIGTDIEELYGIEEGEITYVSDWNNYECFTLEQFKERFPYKVGDKVKNATINDFIGIITNVRWDNNEKQIIYTVKWNDKSTLTYFARDLQVYKEESMENKSNLLQQLEEYFKNTPRDIIEKEWHEYDKYNEISPKVNEYLEYVNNIRQPKYPKTYEECCEVLGIEEDLWFVYEDIDGNHINPACISNYRIRNLDLYHNFEKLQICCDAYWKIAGEEMGLGKPWEPDLNHINRKFYCIYNSKNNIVKNVIHSDNKILAFPTAELRDAFYENFKELIENCKELL